MFGKRPHRINASQILYWKMLWVCRALSGLPLCFANCGIAGLTCLGVKCMNQIPFDQFHKDFLKPVCERNRCVWVCHRLSLWSTWPHSLHYPGNTVSPGWSDTSPKFNQHFAGTLLFWCICWIGAYTLKRCRQIRTHCRWEERQRLKRFMRWEK